MTKEREMFQRFYPEEAQRQDDEHLGISWSLFLVDKKSTGDPFEDETTKLKISIRFIPK